MHVTVLCIFMTCKKLNICPCQRIKIATGALQFAALQPHLYKHVKTQGLHFVVELLSQ